jgi:hypothetical protein
MPYMLGLSSLLLLRLGTKEPGSGLHFGICLLLGCIGYSMSVRSRLGERMSTTMVLIPLLLAKFGTHLVNPSMFVGVL